MGVGGRGTNISLPFTFSHLGEPACIVFIFIAIHNCSSFTCTAAIGPGLARERGDLARGTEVEEVEGEEVEEEVAVTTRDVAPETESVRDDSEPQAITTCPSLPVSIPSLLFFKVVPFQIYSRTN